MLHFKPSSDYIHWAKARSYFVCIPDPEGSGYKDIFSSSGLSDFRTICILNAKKVCLFATWFNSYLLNRKRQEAAFLKFAV